MPLTQREQDELELLTLQEEEQQASQPRTGGGFGALREAEANIPAELPPPKQSAFERFAGAFGEMGDAAGNPPMITKYGTPEREAETRGYAKGAALGARVIPPVVGGIATGGAGMIPFMATGAGTSLIGEGIGQGIEKATGLRDELSTPQLEGAAVRGAAPVFGAGGSLTRGALNFGAAAGANIAGRYLEDGRAPTLGEAAREAALALPAGAAGVASGFISPKGTKELQQAAKAAEEIQTRTGKELPRLVGETTQDLGTLRGELRRIQAGEALPSTPTEEAFKEGRMAVLLAAANAKNPEQKTLGSIAQEARTALEREIGPLNKETDAAINDLSKAYAEGKLGTQEDIQKELQAMIPGSSGESRYSLGSTVKNEGKQILAEFDKKSEEEFSRLRNNPVHDDTSIGDVSPIKQFAKKFAPVTIAKESTVESQNPIVDQFGRKVGEPEVVRKPIPSALPEGTQKYFQQIQEMAPTQSINQLRRWRTDVLNSIGDDSILPGFGDRMKYQLVGAITDSIVGSLSRVEEGLPVGPMRTLLHDFLDSNANYKARVADIDNVFSSGVIKEVGERGALSPETIASRLTGSNAVSALESLKRLYGKNADAIVGKVHGLIRDEVLGQFTNAATGETNIGGLLNHITNDKSFPRELSVQVFPNAVDIQALAKRQLRANGLPTTDNAVRGLLEGDKSVVDAMTSPNKASTLAAADKALAASAKKEAALNSTMVRAIASKDGEALVKNPEVLVKGFLSGSFSPQDVSEAMRVIRTHSPQAASNMEFALTEGLIKNASSGGHIDMARVASEIAAPSGSSSGGPMLGVMQAAIGPERVKNLREVAELAARAETPRTRVADTMNLSPMTVRGIGASALQGALSGMAFGGEPRNAVVGAVLGAGGGTGARGVGKWSDAVKYSIAARLLSDSRLSRLTDLPYDSQRLANAVRLAAHSIELESDDEKLRDEAHKLATELK